MVKIKVVILFLVSILASAHFFRGGDYLLSIFYLLIPISYFVKRRISLTILLSSLLYALIEWIFTAKGIIYYRMINHLPYVRLTLILLTVIFINIITIIFILIDLKKIRKSTLQNI